MFLAPLAGRIAALLAGTAVTVLGPVPVTPTAPSAPTISTAPSPPASGPVAPRGDWRWPLPGTPSVVHPYAAPPGPYAAGHRGVDLAAPVGATVLAPAAGTVTVAGRVAGVPVVVVAHAGGLRSTLQPVTAVLAVGTTVRAGDPVGTVSADPGHCAPAGCVHWGVLRGATYLDPVRLLRPARVVLLPWS